MHVDLDAFFAAVEQRDDPRLKGKPVVVGADPRGGRGRGVVSTCSYEARRFGIRSAMPIAKAYQACPQAVFVRPDFQKYKAASRAVFNIFSDFTPHIEPLSVDEAFLDVTTTAHLFDGPGNCGRRIKWRIRDEVGLTASVGIAPVKFVAKIASDLSKPDGLLIVREEDVLNFLKPLAVERLWGVGPKTAVILKNMGIETIGQLAEIPRPVMRECLGEAGEHLYRLSRGIDERGVVEESGIKSVSHEHTFDTDQADPKTVIAQMLDLSEQVSRRLRKYGLKGRTITVKIRLSGFQTYTRARTLSDPTNFADVIFAEAKEMFLKFFKPGMKIRLIGVRVNQFDAIEVQASLFPDSLEDRREKIHSAIDAIKNKFGEGAIGRGKPLPID